MSSSSSSRRAKVVAHHAQLVTIDRFRFGWWTLPTRVSDPLSQETTTVSTAGAVSYVFVFVLAVHAEHCSALPYEHLISLPRRDVPVALREQRLIEGRDVRRDRVVREGVPNGVGVSTF